MSAEDIAEDSKTYFSLNKMVVDGFKCPDEFLNLLTPMEFEEMVIDECFFLLNELKFLKYVRK